MEGEQAREAGGAALAGGDAVGGEQGDGLVGAVVGDRDERLDPAAEQRPGDRRRRGRSSGPPSTESCGPGTSVGAPASAEASAHAADTGSTPTIRAPAKRRTIAAANEPTPIWTATTSGCTSISAPIVA